VAGTARGEEALVDVLRAVAVGLLDLDGKGAVAPRGERPVDAEAAPRRELDDHESRLLPAGQPVQRVAFPELSVGRERGRARDFEKAARAGQRRGPQAPGGVPGGDDRERAVGEEGGDPAAQLGRLEHRRQARRLVKRARLPLDGQLAGVETDIGGTRPGGGLAHAALPPASAHNGFWLNHPLGTVVSRSSNGCKCLHP
jgi:hypothetical protein